MKQEEYQAHIQVGRARPSTSSSLADVEFTTLCPPDVQPQSRILAVVGPNDLNDCSSPLADGWFHSDFYLFHYLLRLPKFRSRKQTWLTCVSPKTLVEKYQEFTHGDPKTDRRVVLDASMLPAIEQSNNIRVVHEKELLDTFLTLLEEESNNATRDNARLLVLIFGQGDMSNHGFAIGGIGDSLRAPKLTLQDFRERLCHDAEVSLLATSCYASGWVVKPSVWDLDSLDQHYAKGIASAGPKHASFAWDSRKSSGRAAGSILPPPF